MIRYNIRLNTIEDFRKYADVCAQFQLAGYITVKNEKINMHELLDIIEYAPITKAVLTLTICQKEELPLLENYLSKEGMIS